MSRGSLDMNAWLKCGSILSATAGGFHLGVGPFQSATKVPGETVTWFLPTDFFEVGSSDCFCASTDCDVSAAELLQSLPAAQPLSIKSWQLPRSDIFKDQFAETQRRIATGDLQKAVPVVFESANVELTQDVIVQLLSSVLKSEARGYLYGHWNVERGEAVIGLTPELLFDLSSEGILSTMALAGTASSETHDLLNDPKEMKEHRLVIDDIFERLQKIGDVDVGETEVWTPSTLTHLKTLIEARVGSEKFENLIASLHPTPALGGAPREAASEILKQFSLEISRFQFGAPFGRKGVDGSARVVVQIRGLILRNARLMLGSGCGLVKQSIFENEWNELGLKRASVKKVFGL